MSETEEIIGDNGEEFVKCDACQKPVQIDHTIHHGADFDLCRVCSDEFIVSVHACQHQWGPVELDPDWYEPGRFCHRCGVWIDQEVGASWFPFVCDGYVEEPSP